MADERNKPVGVIMMHGIEYPVFIIDDEKDMIDGQLGHNYACVDFKKCHIKINDSSDSQRKKSSLLHEVLHLGLFGSKFADIEDLEDMITRLEQSLSSLGVAEFLWKLHIGGYNAKTDEKKNEKKGKGSRAREGK